MAKAQEKSSFVAEMFSLSLFKRNQGRQARRITGICIAVIFILGGMAMYNSQPDDAAVWLKQGIPWAIGIIGCWGAFRAINFPPFADFLIAVEAEMDKVSWPGKAELWRATVVVLATMFVLGVVLFVSDIIWQGLFTYLDVLHVEPADPPELPALPDAE